MLAGASSLQEGESSVDEPAYAAAHSECAAQLSGSAAHDAVEGAFGGDLLENALEVVQVELLPNRLDDGALVLADLVGEGLFSLVAHHSFNGVRQAVVELDARTFLVDLGNHSRLFGSEFSLESSLLRLNLGEGLLLDAVYLSLQRVETGKVVNALPLESFKCRDSAWDSGVDLVLEVFEDARERLGLLVDHVRSPIIETLEGFVRFGVELSELIVDHFLRLLGNHQLHKGLPILLLEFLEDVPTA
jgi:hypothetical protein